MNIYKTISRMSSCYSDFWYLDWFRNYSRTTEPLCHNFPIFCVFFDPPDPHRQKFKILAWQFLTTKVSEVSENLVETGWPDSENFCWKKRKKEKPSHNIMSALARHNSIILEYSSFKFKCIAKYALLEIQLAIKCIKFYRFAYINSSNTIVYLSFVIG